MEIPFLLFESADRCRRPDAVATRRAPRPGIRHGPRVSGRSDPKLQGAAVNGSLMGRDAPLLDGSFGPWGRVCMCTERGRLLEEPRL